jgi:hypothetical protein
MLMGLSFSGLLDDSSPLGDTPEPARHITMDDEGRVCFFQYEGVPQVQISTEPCFASYCTEVLERTGDMEIDKDNSVIQLHSLFVVRDLRESMSPDNPKECADDCGGAGSTQVEVEDIGDGEYIVKLGDRVIGSVEFPIQDLVCLDTPTPPPP